MTTFASLSSASQIPRLHSLAVLPSRSASGEHASQRHLRGIAPARCVSDGDRS